jgi:hypothetical protein
MNNQKFVKYFTSIFFVSCLFHKRSDRPADEVKEFKQALKLEMTSLWFSSFSLHVN